MKSYACPKCNGTRLEVAVLATAWLYQFEDGSVTTEVNNAHEWDHSHTMTCRNPACMFAAAAATFYVGGGT